ncbi:MAG: hypothetical protein K2M19_03460 [Muribaculaceae bacterium]|nr:hypothetical protein [Muribaculaceae bacterium]
MKKYLLTLLTALLALAASAAEWSTAGFEEPMLFEEEPHLPFYSGYNYTVAQLLYVENDLLGLINITSDGSTTYAEITDLELLCNLYGQANGAAEFSTDISYNVKIQCTEATAFAIENGQRQWFIMADDASSASGTLVYDTDNWDDNEFLDVLYGESMSYPITLHLDNPIQYKGGSLLIQIESNSSNRDCEVFEYCAGFTTTVGSTYGVSHSFKSYDEIYASTPRHSNNNLPAINFHYNPVKGETVKLATIGEPTISTKATSDNKANILTFDFDINSPEEGVEYEIALGTTSLGYTSAQHVTVSYLEPSKEHTISINPPKGSNIKGSSYTIAATDFEKFFKAPEIDIYKTRAYASFEATKKPEVIAGALMLEYKVPEGAAAVIKMGGPNGSAVKAGTTDWCEDFVTPSTDLDDYYLNKGLRSFYQTNLWQNEFQYKYGKLQNLRSATMSINCKIIYPVISAKVPSITDDIPEALNHVSDYYREDPEKKYWTPSIDPNQEGVLVMDIKYADKIEVIKEGNNEFTFIAPAGHTIWHCFSPGVYMDQEWAQNPESEKYKAPARANSYTEDAGTINVNGKTFNKVDSNVYTHDASQTNDGSLELISTTPDKDGNHQVVHSSWATLYSDGSMSGVQNVTVDAAGEVEYFNLQGIRVANPEGGIFIRRQGGKTSKVIR